MQLKGPKYSLWDGAVKGNLDAEAPHLYKIKKSSPEDVENCAEKFTSAELFLESQSVQIVKLMRRSVMMGLS